MPVTSEYRQTGTIARIVDQNLNAWEDFAGTDINIPATYQALDTSAGEWDQAYWAYRGQAAMCQLANGNIVRVRLGDWTSTSDRRIQRQVITDPTDPSQWTAWSWLAYGDNYAIAIERDDAAGAGYRIYHAKSDGVYMDNVLLNIPFLSFPVIKLKTVFGQTNMLYIEAVNQNADGNLEVVWYYSPSTLDATVFNIRDVAQWEHYHQDICAVVDGDTAYRFRAMPMNDAERNLYASDTLTIEQVPFEDLYTSIGDYNTYDEVLYLKGPSKRAGFSRIDDLYVTQLTDPEFGANTWYLFYTERHLDQFGNVLSNLKSPTFWSRAPQGLTLPSQATPTGFSLWGFAGVAEAGGYVYLCGNGRVLRRLIGATTIDITDYVLSGKYSVPRDNEAAPLTLTCANPHNILGAQLGLTSDSSSGLTDRKLDFGIGARLRGENAMTFKRDANWIVSALRKTREGNKDHLIVEGGDFWHKLSNPFRDAWSIPGKFDRSDWQPDAINDISQYTNAHDEIIKYNPAGADAATVPRLRSASSNAFAVGFSLQGTVVLYSGWRGGNASVQATFWAPAGGIIFRYQDESNFSIAYSDSTGTYVKRVVDGNYGVTAAFHSTSDAAKMPAGGGALAIMYSWRRMSVSLNGVSVIEDTWTSRGPLNGFVGFWSPTVVEVSNFLLQEPNAVVTTSGLIQAVLAYADEHNVEFEDDEETLNAPQYDLLLGPQSDLDTPEKIVRQLLQGSNLNIVWRQDE